MKEKTFKCGFCTSNFILNISLKIHVESFHEEKTFKHLQRVTQKKAI